MKFASLLLSFSLFSFSATALTTVVKSEPIEISPFTIDQVINLVDKKDYSSPRKKVNIIVSDRGMSTDVSPRYSIYLGFSSYAEMGNLGASFKISDQAFQFVSASRVSAGIYEVKTVEYRDEGMVDVTHTLDTTQMFIDERHKRDNCELAFCDGKLSTSIEVTETVQLQDGQGDL